MPKSLPTSYSLPATSPTLLVIVGETASGKSELAMRVAKKFNGEIISADSWQVYKGFDIGTSKPSKKQQAKVRHHLLNVVEASESFNAPKFKQLAEEAIADIQKRNKLPILAGGTGLYIDSVLFDFGFLPFPGNKKREILNKLSISELIDLARAEKINLAGIDTRNKRRIIRAVEAKGQRPSKKVLRSGVLIVGLQILREELRKRVEARTEQMIKAGLEQEVKQLADKYGWDSEPMKGVGYQQWRGYFDGQQTLDQTKKRVISATMNLAKRQRIWFKRNPHIQWFSSKKEAFEYISKVMST